MSRATLPPLTNRKEKLMRNPTEQEFCQRRVDIAEDKDDGFWMWLLIAFVAGNVTGAIGSVLLGVL